LKSLAGLPEVVTMPLLDMAAASGLVNRCAGTDIRLDGRLIPKSVREAVQRPLFAILLGLHFRRRNPRTPASTAQLVANLVEDSLSASSIDPLAATTTLQRLARLSIDRMSAVPTCEVGTPEEARALSQSGLVNEERGAIEFVLPILAQWFGALSLLRGEPGPNEVLSEGNRLELWRYPLIIAAGIGEHEQVSPWLDSLARRDPANFADVVSKSLAQWGLSEDIAPPPAEDCGRRVRRAMEALVEGIGPLRQLVAPVGSDGRVHKIGCRVEQGRLTTGWYNRKNDFPEVVSLPEHIFIWGPPGTSPGDATPGIDAAHWNYLRTARPGQQSAWVALGIRAPRRQALGDSEGTQTSDS